VRLRDFKIGQRGYYGVGCDRGTFEVLGKHEDKVWVKTESGYYVTWNGSEDVDAIRTLGGVAPGKHFRYQDREYIKSDLYVMGSPICVQEKTGSVTYLHENTEVQELCD
jgi:hypothetical protein